MLPAKGRLKPDCPSVYRAGKGDLEGLGGCGKAQPHKPILLTPGLVLDKL